MKIKSFIQYFLTFVSIFFIAYQLYKNIEILETIKYIPTYFFLIIFFYVSRIISRAYTNHYLYKNVNIELPFFDALTITLINGLGNYLGPLKAGSGMKLAYLNKKFNLKIIDYMSINTQYSSIYFVASASIATVIMILKSNENQYNQSIYAALLVFLISIFILSISLIRKINLNKLENSKIYFIEKLIKIIKFESIKNNRLNIFLFTSLHALFGFFAIYFCLRIMSVDNTFLDAIFIGSMSQLSTVVNITPGNIGIVEGILFAFKSVYQLNLEEILLFSVISRIFVLIAMLLLNIFLSIKERMS